MPDWALTTKRDPASSAPRLRIHSASTLAFGGWVSSKSIWTSTAFEGKSPAAIRVKKASARAPTCSTSTSLVRQGRSLAGLKSVARRPQGAIRRAARGLKATPQRPQERVARERPIDADATGGNTAEERVKRDRLVSPI